MFKTWHRYVDNIFAVVPNRHIQDALKLLNIQDNSLKIALETEINGLDLKIIRNSNQLIFGIYRKSTHTECYINSNGYNLKSHQHAVFNSLVYRLNTPLKQTEYTKEYKIRERKVKTLTRN